MLALEKDIRGYNKVVKKISRLITIIEEPSTRLKEIQRRNYVYKLKRKLDFLNVNNYEEYFSIITNIENKVNESVKIEKRNIKSALKKIEILIIDIDTIIESNNVLLNSTQKNRLDGMRDELLIKRTNVLKLDYVNNDLRIIESQLYDLSCNINNMRRRKRLLLQSNKSMIETLEQASNYFETSGKYNSRIDKLGQYDYIKYSNKLLDSAVNSMIKYKNDLIHDLDNK